MTFTRFASVRRASSSFAIAAALLAGTALTTVALEAPASAQKKKKEEAPSANYSKGFVAAYNPLKALQDAPAPDKAALTAAIPGLVAAVETEDDRFVAGNAIYNIGRTTEDPAMQYRGVTMMLASGKVPAANAGQYNFLAGQLAYNADNPTEARTYLQAAFDAGYTDPDPRILIAETYFAGNQYPEGLDYLSKAIAARTAAGEPVDEKWVKRGLSVAYQNELRDQAMQYATMYAQDYPSADSWSDAIAVALNLNDYQAPETLDLLRLARRLDAIKHSQMYLEYIEVADARRLPGEVVSLIDQGWNSGVLERSNSYAVDSRAQASNRLAADKADLPNFAKEARASGATLNTVIAAGDAFLSYDRGAEAEEFYNKALNMPGANTPLILTRLGIAQMDQGKYADAKLTFAKVEGARQAIARLWGIYAGQKGG